MFNFRQNYQILYMKWRILYQYSGWFLVLTTILHFVQFFATLPSFLAYVTVVIGFVVVLPASVPSLIETEDDTFSSYLLYDLGNHVFLPLCTFFHLDNTIYSSITPSIVFIFVGGR